MPNADRLIEIFNEAKARPAGPERERFLAETCAGEPELQAQVLSLLQAHEGAGEFLKNTLVLSPTALVTEKPGDKIGHYKLLQQLGEGGCGVVYMAEQTEPVRRKVALKVIKLGMDTKQVVARFEAERQALALMDHSNIAKVFDAGATDTGRPYFVMELVRGIKITDYCDQNRLTTRARLDLFIQVCQAIQHAHQKGIIHRDIKPSNVLVSQHDTVAVPKVIDFGIAKATSDQPLTDKTLFTAFEQFMGTPAYMSPEQAQLSGLDIDTRTDIYSLGVLLYELLTGETPFDPEELMKSGLEAMRKTIREQEPVRPSKVVESQLELRVERVTGHGRQSGTTLNSQLKPLSTDLDWIVMKCLEKERTRRYETANSLAADLQRHLGNEPVLARPPSAGYRFQKAFRRHKLAFTAAAAVGLALVAGVMVSTWQAIEASRARNAEKEQRLAAQTQRDHAQTAQEKAEEAAANEARQHDRAEEFLSRMDLQRAEELFAANDARTALAYLARVLRNHPTNRVAVTRLLSSLTYRPFALPAVVPLQHEAHVNWAEFSPDGKEVLTVSGSAVRIWDAQSGRQKRSFDKHRVVATRFGAEGPRVVTVAGRTATLWDARAGAQIFSPLTHDFELPSIEGVKNAAFSGDGRQLLTACWDESARVSYLRIWDAHSGQPLTPPLQHKGRLEAVQFSPDGRLLVTGSSDHVARVWDLRAGRLLFELLGHISDVWHVEFSPDGRWILTASFDETARVWEAHTGKLLIPPVGRLAPGLPAHFSPDGQRGVRIASNKSAVIWDAHNGSPLVADLKEKYSHRTGQFSPDGLLLLTTAEDNSARVWDAQTGQPLTEPIKHEAEITSSQFSPDGWKVLTTSADTTARIWDVRGNGSLLVRYPHRSSNRESSSPVGCQFSPDGERLVTLPKGRSALIVNSRTGDPVSEFLVHTGLIRSVCFSLDGRLVATASEDKTARVWDGYTGQPVSGSLCHDDMVVTAQFSPDAQWVVTGSDDGTARVWDARTGQALTEPLKHRVKNTITFVQVSNDGRRLLTVQSPEVLVWDARTGEPLMEPLTHSGNPLQSAQFSPDGQWILTAARDRTLRIWDALTGQLRMKPIPLDTDPMVARFTPDGRRIAVVGQGYTVQFYDAATGQPLGGQLEHDGRVSSAEFSPDGERVVTVYGKNRVRVWDTASAQPLSEVFDHDEDVLSAQFSPQGDRVLTVSLHNATKIWELPHSQPPIPDWLPDLAESVGGVRLNEGRIPEAVPVDRFAALKQHLTASSANDSYSIWAKWFLADRSQRPIFPHSPITVPEYIRRRIAENTLESLRAALQLSPTNGLGFARLARLTQAQSRAQNPRRTGEAEYYSRRAVELAPDEPEAWIVRAEALEAGGQMDDALAVFDRASERTREFPEFWNTKGQLLQKTGGLDEAYQAFSKAIDLGRQDTNTFGKTLTKALLNRWGVLKKLNRLTEAQADFLRGRNIPERDPQASTNLIDLSLFYNAALNPNWHRDVPENDLAGLATGAQTLAGTTFDVRGLIQVRLNSTEYPAQVNGIEVGRKCRRLHFLHAATGAAGITNGTQIGSYAGHLADGQSFEMPIVVGQDLSDWWEQSGETNTTFAIAWTGTNEKSRRSGEKIRLFKSTWENSSPDVALRSIDFHATHTKASPFLIAITAE